MTILYQETMHKDAIGNYYITNGELIPLSEIINEKNYEKPIYEVVRLMGGTPLFLEDHINRLKNSAGIMNFSINEHIKFIFDGISKLLINNNITDMNFRLLVEKNYENETKINYLLYFIKSTYPSKEDYINGVSAVLFHTERENPNAKALNSNYRHLINQRLKETGVYEVILVNEKNSMTEGSRSNLFIICEGCLYTPPAKDVLIGITRKKYSKLPLI